LTAPPFVFPVASSEVLCEVPTDEGLLRTTAFCM
jgi:hypothetical protein